LTTPRALIADAVVPPQHAPAALQVVVMGVSGCGKSTVGAALAQALGLAFIEGDSLHPARNVALMAAGTALTDDDRAGWLATLADKLAQAQAKDAGLVLSCSALKRSYRDLLRARCPGLRLVYLQGTAAQLASRLQARSGHYMPASLLASQLSTLEPPAPDEQALRFDITLPAHQISNAAALQLSPRRR
jgi:gluconokinase